MTTKTHRQGQRLSRRRDNHHRGTASDSPAGSKSCHDWWREGQWEAGWMVWYGIPARTSVVSGGARVARVESRAELLKWREDPAAWLA